MPSVGVPTKHLSHSLQSDETLGQNLRYQRSQVETDLIRYVQPYDEWMFAGFWKTVVVESEGVASWPQSVLVKLPVLLARGRLLA